MHAAALSKHLRPYRNYSMNTTYKTSNHKHNITHPCVALSVAQTALWTRPGQGNSSRTIGSNDGVIHLTPATHAAVADAITGCGTAATDLWVAVAE
jgi:hypothetical protein